MKSTDVAVQTVIDWRWFRVRRLLAPGRSRVLSVRVGDHDRLEAQITLRRAAGK